MTTKEAIILLQDIVDIFEIEDVYPTLRDRQMSALKIVLKSLKNKPEWIPFTRRPLTEEEKEDRLGLDFILDCDLPQDYQEILITVDCKGHKSVQLDTFYFDPDGCDLDNGYTICDEAVAWMPLPEPYQEGEENGQQN